MKSKKEILKSPAYWYEKIQNDLFRELYRYMDENNKTQSDIAREMNVTKGYISQILNGNFNPTLKKLIEFSLFVKKLPVIGFVTEENYKRRGKAASARKTKRSNKYENQLILNDIKASRSAKKEYIPLSAKGRI
ncbi:MAG: XRE family transcriptional regulator [Ignavibacteriae bacterium]|nr:MAG: XRE family transcriptional regulator [Ignavibacteriota bacterium]